MKILRPLQLVGVDAQTFGHGGLTSHGVLTKAELVSRYEVTLENYCKTILIEANTMVDMARTEIIPAVQAFALDTAKTAAAKRELVLFLQLPFHCFKAVYLAVADGPAALQLERLHPLGGQAHDSQAVKARVDRFCHDGLEEVCGNIREKLIAGVEKRLVADAKVGFLLSGGLDSSLVCSAQVERA